MADLRPQFSEEVVGHGHPTKADVTNRAWNVEHEEDGTHKDNVIVNDNLGPDSVDGTKIEDNSIDSEHYVDGSIDTIHVGNAQIDKDKLNADVVGTGLAGGAGTALSVDGIVEVGASAELKPKLIDIGNWDMNAVASVDVAHGLAHGNIRHIEAWIRRDDDAYLYPLDTPFTGAAFGATQGYIELSSVGAKVTLYRLGGGLFTLAGAFDADPYNRGWITIWYVV